VRLWDVPAGRERVTLLAGGESPCTLAFAAGGFGPTVWVWDFPDDPGAPRPKAVAP
jgi:hypothetical protein